MRAYGKTDIGKVRESNQDCFVLSTDGALPVWAVVCDGMGGVSGGYYASSTAAASFTHSMEASFEGLKPRQIENLLREAISVANTGVYEAACAQSDLTGMGTTLVAALVLDETAYVAHVGDSRAYLIGKDGAHRLTVDHSVVQQLVQIGQITEDEARVHPEKHMITRAVGVKESVDADVHSFRLKKGDRLLLCTDGLTNFISDDELAALAAEHPEAEEAVAALIETALQRGGSDNITAVILQ